VSSRKLSDLFTGPARKWTWSVPLTEPIFTAGAIAGQVKQAEAFKQETLLQYQKTIQNAFRDVEDSLADQSLTQKRLQEQKTRIEALRSYSRVARLRYDNGYTDYITVLDAERSLFGAELDYTQTQEQLFQALTNLYKAMGGGWRQVTGN
jgi:outer membrane protein, multidrug efflux system